MHMERVCFLHIGTHKTGTTSLQTLLTSNKQCLERSGILVPRSGRAWTGGGHHNLAWEWNGDDRFNLTFGAWRDVLGELRSSNFPAVCLSSEDFEYLHRKPDSLSRIRQDLNSIGYQVRVVVYLRPQADYVESLYAELVKHGVHAAFREYLGEILQSGAMVHRDSWGLVFDYRQLLDPFAKAFGTAGMVVRPYSATRPSNDLLNNFVSVISRGHRIAGLDFAACRERHNPSPTFSRLVALLLANRRKREETFASKVSNSRDDHFMNGSFDPLNLRDLIRIQRRFREANRVVWDKYRVKLSSVSGRRLRREILCTVGLNRDSTRRKNLLAQLDRCDELP